MEELLRYPDLIIRKSFSFADSYIDLLVGNSLEVNVNASEDIDLLTDIKYTFNGENELTLENTTTGLKITGNKHPIWNDI